MPSIALRLAALTVLTLASAVAGAARFPPNVTRAELERALTALRTSRALDVDGPLRWRYRFSTSDARALEAWSVTLVADGFRIVELGPGAAPDLEILVMERVERQTPAGLARMSRELGARARAAGIRYDGFDVLPTG